jgi:hypothetical protein
MREDEEVQRAEGRTKVHFLLKVHSLLSIRMVSLIRLFLLHGLFRRGYHVQLSCTA